jgi:hypothetical protein
MAQGLLRAARGARVAMPAAPLRERIEPPETPLPQPNTRERQADQLSGEGTPSLQKK